MNAQTEKQYLDIFTKQSVLLTPPASDHDRKLRPGKHFGMISGIVGIRSYLDRLVNEQRQGGTIKPSRIDRAKEQLTGAKSALEHVPGNELYVERINRHTAQIKVYEMEARKCNSLIKKWEAEEKVREEARTQSPAHLSSGKISFGILTHWAGRKVEMSKKGYIFCDDKSSVQTFKDKERAKTLERAAAKEILEKRRYQIAEKLVAME